jgi:uncharacterized membrane protein YczE
MSVNSIFGVPRPRARRVVQLNLGLVLFGVSLAMLVKANLGLDPWDVLHQGLATVLGLPLGAVVVVVSFVVLTAWIPLRQRPGLGTVLNAVVVGFVFEAAIILLGTTGSTAARWVYFLGALVLNAVATGMYVGAGLGPGPRDGLMTGLAARGYSVRLVRTAIEASVLVVGWLLGGTVGFGTVVFALSIGPLVHFCLSILTIPDISPQQQGQHHDHTLSRRDHRQHATPTPRPGHRTVGDRHPRRSTRP